MRATQRLEARSMCAHHCRLHPSSRGGAVRDDAYSVGLGGFHATLRISVCVGGTRCRGFWNATELLRATEMHARDTQRLRTRRELILRDRRMRFGGTVFGWCTFLSAWIWHVRVHIGTIQ